MSKRKPVVRCCAEEDDEDSENFDALPKVKKLRDVGNTAATSSTAAASEAPKKKEKAFAWMDSDDEAEPAKEAPPEKEVDDEKEDVDESENVPLTIEALDEVHSFGRMMLLAPALEKKLKEQALPASEMAASFRALGRAKFFDGDLLEKLSLVVQKYLDVQALTVNEVNDCMECIALLNFSDHDLLAAIARAYRKQVAMLQPGMRQVWLDAFKLLKHDRDKDFLQMLEVPPVLPSSPAYLKVRCRHFVQGSCVLGDTCTFAHDARAAPTLADVIANQEHMKFRPTLMTETQELQGEGVYGRAGAYQSGQAWGPSERAAAASGNHWGMAPTRPPAAWK